MAIIRNIPEAMINEHIAWHNRPGNPSAGGRRINPFPPAGRRPALGSGEEFLVWHSGFIQRFKRWVDNLASDQQPDPASVQSWRAIPQMLKMSMLGWNARLASEEQQLRDMTNFSSLDHLGRFLEWSIHGFLHNAASDMWSEPELLSFESPRSTYFWQLHGLIDGWRQQWVDQDTSKLVTTFLPLETDGRAIQASIGAPGEMDQYSFRVTVDGTLIVETNGPSDVVLYIAGPDNPNTIIFSNDDGGQGFNARVEERFTQGNYYVYVVFYDRSDTGNYGISVTQ